MAHQDVTGDFPNAASPVEGDWHPIATAPRDGTVIDLTWMLDGEPQDIHRMQWGHIRKVRLFPDLVGCWIAPDGRFTWVEFGGEGPTHWRPSFIHTASS